MRLISSLLLCVFLAACGGTMPSRPVMGERSITPREAVQDITQVESVVVEWGGVIVETNNLPDSTEIQIIAYPLKDNGRPNLNQSPTGRFIAVNQGYLETADYPKGRSITLSGTISDIRQGKVGEADYSFPLVHPNEMQLWPAQTTSGSGSSIHFGIGVGSGGWSRGGVGVGVGL